MEILVLHPGALGDIILSLPAIGLLRKCFSSARITIAGNLDYLTTAAGPLADSLLSLSALPLHRLYMPGALLEEEARFWKSFDRIVSWTGAGDPEFTGKMKQLHPGACIASWRPEAKETRHVSQLFVDSLRAWIPAGARAVFTKIWLSPDIRDQGLQWLREHGGNIRDRIIALHPGAGSPAKRWPLSRFIELAGRLALQERMKLLIIEGPAEYGVANEVAEKLPAAKTVPVESVPLDLLAALLERCEVFVGNDSGIAHLAAAVGVPSVVLFGPSLPQHWSPLGEHVYVLRDARDCGACALGQGEHTCLSNISVEDVIRSVKSSHCFTRRMRVL